MPQGKDHVLKYRHVWPYGVGLEYHPGATLIDLNVDFLRGPEDDTVVQLYLALIGGLDSSNATQCGALTTSGWTQEGEDLALLYLKGHTTNRFDLSLVLNESFS